MNTAQVWRAAQDRLRQQMSKAQFDTFFGGTWLAEGEDGATLLCVRTTFAKESLERHFRDRISAAIAAVTGQLCALRVVVAPPESNGDERAAGRTIAHARATRGSQASTRASAAGRMASVTVPQTLFDLPAQAVHSTAPAAFHADHAATTLHDATPPTVLASGGSAGRSGSHYTPPPGGIQRGRITIPLASTGSTTPGGGSVPAGLRRTPRPAAHIPSDDAADDSQQGSAANSPDDGAPTLTSYATLPFAQPRLNPRYTFSTFIVGSGNQLAHAASQAVAEVPGEGYNPLFLYGGVGLGKTHLLHAIGHATMERGLVVLYVSSETFTNEIINAIRYRSTDEFRAKYRSVDVLLVDDIQFIAGKESTEEEFFHTFNSLHEANKQIVICSDRPPKAIVSLAERLRSRFEWGLIADIQPPDTETRAAILRAKAEMMGQAVPDEVINFLAGRVQSNIRELEGSLNRLLAFAQLQGLPLTVETVKAALASLANDGRQRRVSIDEILTAVAEHFRVSAQDLCGKQRDKHIVVPRQIAMYLMRQETEASLLEIGQALGGRDHSTVLHGCDKIGRQINEDTSLRKEVLTIRQQLLG
ncbi:MAG TPA: chromosomal replication initiator protein DnaA [Ktedonobacterales bacterium]|nr:chromosomal replication initiator protein DnaA [Ktedonobacterales bacterium]